MRIRLNDKTIWSAEDDAQSENIATQLMHLLKHARVETGGCFDFIQLKMTINGNVETGNNNLGTSISLQTHERPYKDEPLFSRPGTRYLCQPNVYFTYKCKPCVEMLMNGKCKDKFMGQIGAILYPQLYAKQKTK